MRCGSGIMSPCTSTATRFESLHWRGSMLRWKLSELGVGADLQRDSVPPQKPHEERPLKQERAPGGAPVLLGLPIVSSELRPC